MFTSSFVVSSVRSTQLYKQLPWILKEELASPETVLFHCTPMNPPLNRQTSAYCRQHWISSCALTWGVMTLSLSENRVTVLSDHQNRTNIFCRSAEFFIFPWIQSSANFAFPGVQQCKLVFVSLATYKYVKHWCISHGHLRTEHIWPQRYESMFANYNCFFSVPGIASFGLFQLHYCSFPTFCCLIISFIFFRKENCHSNLHFCFNRLPSTFCTSIFLIFKITSHIQHSWRKSFPAFWATLLGHLENFVFQTRKRFLSLLH